jgi:hypothetical protein
MISIGHSQTDLHTHKAVQSQLERYPSSTLQDLYKSFFQDEFGPGHLVGDTAAARIYLEKELDEMTSRQNYFAEPCGAGEHFYRVPLDLVKDGLIPKEDYLAAFLQSAASFKIPDVQEWRAKWQGIVRDIESMNIIIPGFEADKEALEQMLEQGDYVVHHSDNYRKAYDPHYRIISKMEWDKLNSDF